MLTGVEAHGDVKLTNEITAEVTYDMVRGELKDSGDPLPRIPPQRVLARTHAIRRTRSRSAAARRSYRIRIACLARSCRPKAMRRRGSSRRIRSRGGGVLNTITARLDNADDTLYRNHLNYLKDVLPEIGRSFKVVYSIGF